MKSKLKYLTAFKLKDFASFKFLLLLLLFILYAANVQAKSYDNEIEKKREKLISYLSSVQLSQEPKTKEGKKGIELYQQFLTGKQDALTKSVVLLKKATKNNDSEAMSWLGQLYFKGIGVELDKEKGLALLRKSDELGNASGSYNLGILLFQEQTVFGETDEAIEFVKKAYRQGFPLAISALGNIELARANPKKAIKYFEEGKQKGDLYSISALGGVYIHGRGVKRDTKRGLALLEHAWEHGLHDAGLSLYATYGAGRGVKVDHKKAIQYVKEAAILGSADAYAYWCSITMNGYIDVKKDLNAAISQCKKGVELGSIVAPRTLSIIYLFEPYLNDPKLFHIGRKWLYYAANKGNPEAMSEIASWIYSGKFGFEPNYDEAYQWAKQGAELGHPLGMLVLAGLSVNTNKPLSKIKQPDYQSCWFWSSIVQTLTPGRNSSAGIRECGAQIDQIWKQSKQLEIAKKIKFYRLNYWTNEHISKIKRGGFDVNNF